MKLLAAIKNDTNHQAAFTLIDQRVAVLVKELIHPWLNSTPFVDDH